jgi:predicted dehydrogenase
MDVVRWGLIGTGEIARKAVAPALRALETCTLHSVASRREGSAEAFARAAGATRWYTRWEDLVCDCEIDAVYVATPHHLHAEQAIAAARSGKHVLCEKPMALGGDQCRSMIAACRAAGVKLGVAYYRRFYPLLTRIKALMAEGAVGTVSLCQINSFTWYDLKPEDPQHWLFERGKSGGGPLMIGGCHRIEMLLNLFGPISETISLKGNVHAVREIEDTAAAVFRHGAGPISVLSMAHSIREQHDTLHIFGSEGSIHVPALNRGEMSLIRRGQECIERHPAHANPHLPLIRSFADAVLKGEEPETGGALGLEVQLVEDSIYAVPGQASAGRMPAGGSD